MIHIFGESVRRAARAVELEFFRIERQNRWLAGLCSGLIAGLSVGSVSWLFDENDLLLFACLGSSAASVVFMPLSRNNSLRSILIAYGVAGLSSAALYVTRDHAVFPLAFRCALSVGIAVASMRLLDALHPAAVGSALAFVIFDRDLSSLIALTAAIFVVLFVVKVIAYAYLEPLEFAQFHREFRREYYGKEIHVTVATPSTAEAKPSSDDSST